MYSIIDVIHEEHINKESRFTSEEHKAAYDEAHKAGLEIAATIGKKELDDLLDLLSTSNSYDVVHSYKSGFADGVRLMLEVMAHRR